ncbi:hypothetical protein LTR95_014098 [Oleoguttula sp. CCFEE 5521]
MIRTAALALAALPAAWTLELADQAGKLPALGWNSWNAYGCDIDEPRVMLAANALVDTGLKGAGYEYVITDDCWQNSEGRDPITSQLRPNLTKFPTGLQGTAEKIHDLGLKVGYYSSSGSMTCGRYAGSLGYEKLDAKTFSDWGMDYLKYDNCFVEPEYFDDCLSCNSDPSFDSKGMKNGSCTSATPQTGYYSFNVTFPFCNLDYPNFPSDGVNYTQKYTALRFRIMRDALLAQNRTIVYSLCEWGVDQPWRWGNATGSSWRTTNDINSGWSRILQILNVNSFLGDYADFYGHNDPDMLEIGNGNLTVEEQRSHFALWAMMKSPLLIGTDITKLTQPELNILENKYLIAFNQDGTFGKPAKPYKWGTNPDYTFNSTFPAQYWAGQSDKGTMVATFNPYNDTKTMTAQFSEIPGLKARGRYRATDVWTGKDMGCKRGSIKTKVEPHDTAVYLLTSC